MGGGKAIRNSSGILQRRFEVQSQWFVFAKVFFREHMPISIHALCIEGRIIYHLDLGKN